MAALNFFQDFFHSLGLKEHNLHTDVLKVYLTNNAPSAADDVDRADLVGITEENGYAAADITNTYTEAAGVGSLNAVDVVVTATGVIETFRYVVIFNDTHADDALVCWWDYGSGVDLGDGDTFTIDFGSNKIFTIQVTV